MAVVDTKPRRTFLRWPCFSTESKKSLTTNCQSTLVRSDTTWLENYILFSS